MVNNTETPEAITAEEKKRYSKRLGIKEFIIALVIIVVVWAARKCFDANVLSGDAPSVLHPPETTATMPVSSEVNNNGLNIHRSEIDDQYRAEYDRLFQQALEAKYAEEDY